MYAFQCIFPKTKLVYSFLFFQELAVPTIPTGSHFLFCLCILPKWIETSKVNASLMLNEVYLHSLKGIKQPNLFIC